ncbi:MAG: tetratricopeptide repeat protein, partial [Anaerolineales bacterium]|nr:tetratricopeptide repeat protein [Anaerolineales bacterium]
MVGCATSRAVKEADQFANQGAWDEAVVIYGDLLNKKPDDVYYKLKYLRARNEAARVHDKLGGEALDGGNLDIALFEFKTAMALDPTLKTAEESYRITHARVKSFNFYDKGLSAVAAGKDQEARRAFNKALSLYPDNASAQFELNKLTVKKGIIVDGVALDIKSSKPITLEFKQAKIKRIFAVFSKLSGINFVFDSDVKDKAASIQMKDATFVDVLELLLITNKLSKKVVSENTILIYPLTAKKRKQYEDMVVKVFYLENIEAKKAINLIRTMVQVKDIYVHEELNALVI